MRPPLPQLPIAKLRSITFRLSEPSSVMMQEPPDLNTTLSCTRPKCDVVQRDRPLRGFLDGRSPSARLITGPGGVVGPIT